ncbi:hypothetical protein C8J56DRAFT_1067594 [Mycena floridula]|nr:hypothetical protein C8J56DRAFT_1067594 [Mycena floridula]
MDGTESNNLTVVQSDSKVLSLAQSVIAGGLILSIAQSRNISEDIPLLDPWKSAAAMAYILGRTMTGPLERIGAWNWTASGHISVSTPRSTDINHTTVIVRGEIQFRDSNTVKNVTLNFAGIQFVTTNRSIYAFAEQSVRDILVPRHIQNETVSIVKPELTARVARLANLFGDGFIDQYPHLDEKPGARCPFAVSGQLTTVKISDESIQELEYELRIKPSGSSTVWAPLSANVLFLSRECSIMDQIMEAEALRASAFFRKVNSCETFPFLVAAQLSCTTDSATAALIYALLVILATTVSDGISIGSHAAFASCVGVRPSSPLVVPAFLASILCYHEALFSAQP